MLTTHPFYSPIHTCMRSFIHLCIPPILYHLPSPLAHRAIAQFYPPQPPDLYIDVNASEHPFSPTATAAAFPHPYSPDMFVDSPISPHAPELQMMPGFTGTSLHSRPLPTGPTRSYTLEGAITPVSPKPRAATTSSVSSSSSSSTKASPSAASTSSRASAPSRVPKRKSESPPPMGSLRPPSPDSVPAQTKTKPQTLPSTSHTVKSEPTAAPTPAERSSPQGQQQQQQKRPRGRPRKNPSTVRAASPPPVVDYPFPQFPPGSSSSSSSSPGSASASTSVSGAAAGATTTTGTGTTAAGTSTTTATMTVTGGQMAPGQAMFQLNMSLGEEGGEGKESEKKKPIMACLFCRERKIACGPPPPGGPQRCK